MVSVSEDSAEESCGELNGRNNGLNSDSVICDARCWPQNKRDLLPIAGPLRFVSIFEQNWRQMGLGLFIHWKSVKVVFDN